ncbi:MAG: hypothetical protein K6G62_05010, partial [Eubacterium sp.]|nr:hypothetical protein [Eubacterium sp.]
YSSQTEQEAKTAYNVSLDKDLATLISDDEDTSEELKKAYRNMLVQVYKNMKYEIGNVTAKSDGSYEVVVKAYRLICFKNTVEPALAVYNSLSEKEMNAMTEEEAYDFVYKQMIENVISNLKVLEYAEETTDVTVTVAPIDGAGDTYVISSEDYQTLYAALMDGSEWSQEDDEAAEDAGEDEADSEDSEEADETIVID